jgi:putative glutamine amidotransferase
MLKIGITACFMYPDVKRLVFGKKTLSYVENEMAAYIAQKGILPVLIPDLAESSLGDLLGELDGFVLQGGNDLAPQTYGEEPILEGRWKGDAYRDKYEMKILDFAVKTNKPVLGICRGLQLMNAYFGGTLYQDNASQRQNILTHRDADLYDKVSHGVSFTKGKILDKIYSGEKNPRINTVHHQSIKDLGKDLEILAICPEDGTIEAIGYTGAEEGKIMGVQWHPEFSAALKEEVVDAQKLLDVFFNHVKKSKNASN